MGSKRAPKDGRGAKRRAGSKGTARAADAPATLSPVGYSLTRHKELILLAAGTILLASLIFAPVSIWPLAFVCLVPWLILVSASQHARRVYIYSYLMALVFFLWNMRWLIVPTGLGYVALSIHQALFFPLLACPLRHAVRRRRIPLAITLPFVWTAGEMLRASGPAGFPWFFLSHSVYEVLTLIQVSDLVGAYGVSFLVAAVNGAVADLVLARLARPREEARIPMARRARIGAIAAASLVLMASIYGQYQLRRDTTRPGPKIAVLQGDYISDVTGGDVSENKKMRDYLAMLEAAAAEKPDLYILPESPWTMFLNPYARNYPSKGALTLSRTSFNALRSHAMDHNATIVTGSATWMETPEDLLVKERRYNSATVFRPDGSEPGRYDKIHLVLFGEYVPFRFGNLRFLYKWLNGLMPFSGPQGDREYSLFPGEVFRRFDMKAASQDGASYRFGIPICYEDVMPYVSRRFVSGGADQKQVDFLLNISNDGWFGRGIQQPQHLAICAFRAVENRVGIARAVNTGVSAFIEPSGRIHGVVTGDEKNPWPGIAGYAVARLGVDSRYSIYSRYGDWFGWGCVLIGLMMYADYVVVRVRGAGERVQHET